MVTYGPSRQEIKSVEAKLGYKFKDRWLLRQALTHPSAGPFNNYRLSWIGDAVLGLVVSQLVFDAFPTGSTEVLNNMRCQRIRRKVYARAAIEMGWDKILVVQPPQLKNSENMLAELFEAVWGALYEDCGAKDKVVRKCYRRCLPLGHHDEHGSVA
ncbi:g3567 [Coccomyxa viridis]|uniref:G3567 protein n=1 Tax=Coccomyxa viridis TaxID=1274662 RepID=A0ABP1FQF0_9CHLO